jgi:hypothetical protein
MSLNSTINYIRQDIPEVDIPPYRGETYPDLVPDTFDLAERIELAVNGVTGPTDPAADCEIYFWANFFHQPPVLTHDWNDCCQPKFMEALPLLRIASGSLLNHHVDEVWKEVILRSIGPDGLYYMPLTGGSFYRINMGSQPVFGPDGQVWTTDHPNLTQLSSSFPNGRLLNALTIYYLRNHNPVWTGIADQMIQRLAEMAIYREGYCFYPVGLWSPMAQYPRDLHSLASDNMCDWGGARLLESLARYYQTTGYPPAIHLAAQLAQATRHHSFMFDEKGSFINRREYTPEGQAAAPQPPTAQIVYGGHFHSHTLALLGLVDYGVVAQDRELIDFCRMSYEWARLQGSTLTGYFPTILNPQLVMDGGLPYSGVLSPFYDEFEICELADMIAIALKLSAAGINDYYDDVERWVRNFFSEGQLTRIDWIYTRPRYMDTRPLFPNETAERVAERSLGGFGGWLNGNDWATRMGLMHCCTGNAARTLYYLWEHLLHADQDTLQVNLRFNHASPWADVYSYDPYEGRLDLKLKKAYARLRLHAPEWVEKNSGQLQVSVNDQPRAFTWDGRYIEVGSGHPGDVVTMTYPLKVYSIKEQLGDGIYTLTLKGNTVVDIDPKGRHSPLFQRAHYRENQVRWRKVQRFVSGERILW